MVFSGLKKLFNNEWVKEAREKLKMREEREKEKEDVSQLFDGLSKYGRNLCLKLLGESKYTLQRCSESLKKNKKSLEDALKTNNISLEDETEQANLDETEQANLEEIIKIIKYWHVRHKRDCLIRLGTKYSIENVFSFIKASEEAGTEEEEREISIEEYEYEIENKRRREKEEKKEKRRKIEEKKEK